MSDEVKAALKVFGSEDYLHVHIQAAWVLARAYAAEHPADEDEPITPEWLNGLLPWDDVIEGKSHSGKFVWTIYHHGSELVVDNAGGWFALSINQGLWPIPLTTRGQLLRLLKELEQ